MVWNDTELTMHAKHKETFWNNCMKSSDDG